MHRGPVQPFFGVLYLPHLNSRLCVVPRIGTASPRWPYPGIPIAAGRSGAMPYYFFQIHNGEKIIPDPEGSELPDQAAVGKGAAEGARDLITVTKRRNEDTRRLRFGVTAESGRHVPRFPFSAAIQESGG